MTGGGGGGGAGGGRPSVKIIGELQVLFSMNGPLNRKLFCQEEVSRSSGIGNLNCDIRVCFHLPSEIVSTHCTFTWGLYLEKNN